MAVLAPNIWGGHGPMASATAWAYNRGLGAEPPAGYRDRGSGAKPRWSWSTFGFLTLNGSRTFTHFSEIWKHKEIGYFCYLCQKKSWAAKLGGLEQNWGPVSPSPGLKPPLIITVLGMPKLCHNRSFFTVFATVANSVFWIYLHKHWRTPKSQVYSN